MLLVRELVPYWSSTGRGGGASNGSRGSAVGARSRPSGSCRSRQQLLFLLLLVGGRERRHYCEPAAPRALPLRPLNLSRSRSSPIAPPALPCQGSPGMRLAITELRNVAYFESQDFTICETKTGFFHIMKCETYRSYHTNNIIASVIP